MKYRMLGNSLKVSALGLGCMPMAGVGNNMYGVASEAESIATIHRAIDLGVTLVRHRGNLWTAPQRGAGRPAIAGRRDGLVIATKFGFRFDESGLRGIDSSPDNVRRACEGSLKRLGDRDDRPLSTSTASIPTCRSRTPSARWPSWCGGEGPPSRPVRSGHGDHPPRRRGPSDRRAPIRIFAVGARRRGGNPAALPRTRHRLRPLFSPLGRGFLTGQIKARRTCPKATTA